MKFFLSCGLLLLVLMLASSKVLAASVPSGNTAEKHVRNLTTWLRSNGGYFNFKLEIRRVDPKDPTSEFGVFAKKNIKAKERLMEIPADLILTPKFDFALDADREVNYFEREYFESSCELMLTLIAEMELGDDSEFAVYVNYLKQKDRSMIPAMWSEAGKELMRQIENPTGDRLPPSGAVDWVDDFVNSGCIDINDKFEKRAAILVLSRGRGNSETVLVPVLDMINHSNNKEARNTESTTVITDTSVHVRAFTEIKAGEQLFLSYNDCVDCQDKADSMGTPEILREHGFLESYPQRWYFGSMYVVLDEVEDGNGKTIIEASHFGAQPSEIDLEWMTEQMIRLQHLLDDDAMIDAPDRVPEKELETILLYHSAVMKALSGALKKGSNVASDHEFTCIAEDSCPAELPSWFRYKDLDKSPRSGLDLYYKFIYQCETLAFEESRQVEEDVVESHYQVLRYVSYPETKDMCFYLDGTWQICASYRPQYHEMGVHDTIRYLPYEPKRVLWVGGGDTMFLHEILKYPSLELAVGLELDQKVARGAFKWFGAQPHWDNEKVQWWFGDASKSLLMLPEDYYGSFDVVLVDLSDTVLSLSVTKEMDIIGALSLLLKPNGVFAMNELVCLLRRLAGPVSFFVCFPV
jgi:spermidine synthase